MRINRPRPEPLTIEVAAADGLEGFADARGLPVDYLTSIGVHISPDDSDKPGWIAIPYPHLTGYWHTRYRNPGPGPYGAGNPKYWAKPGTQTHLYNPQRLGPNTDLVIFTEGEIDAMVLGYLGYPAIGIPGATIAQRFHGSWQLLFQDTHVIVALDPDPAGQTAASKLQEAFATRGQSHILTVPEGSDINDWYLTDEAALRYAVDAVIAKGTP